MSSSIEPKQKKKKKKGKVRWSGVERVEVKERQDKVGLRQECNINVRFERRVF